ncbi:MAG: hypothetical protein IKS46_02270 [Clostridia bacterium]|nr:hypothetical protein [Clostridia bacterium]
MFFQRKLIRKLKNSWGKKPEGEYREGDMTWIRSWYDDYSKSNPNQFYVDDTTWKDLDMDDVYKRINACCSTAGEQSLYYMLRHPMDRADFERQAGLISMMEEEPDTRLTLQKILSKVGIYRSVWLGNLLHPQDPSRFWLVIYSLLALFLPVSIACVLLIGTGVIWMPFLSLLLNLGVHDLRQHRCQNEICTVNYCVLLVFTLRRMRRLKHSRLDHYLEKAYADMDPLRFVLRFGSIAAQKNTNDLLDALMPFLMWDLVYFEVIKSRLVKYHRNFEIIHEAVGGVDAAISVASYRASTETFSVPVIDYDADHPYIHAEKMVHPLLSGAVPNDVMLDRSLLITGSNASGKSTYLRAAVLSALLAQTICTSPCASYSGSPFRIYSSMALSDNLLSGESYYIAEIKSLKRILDSMPGNGFVLCAIDEVLRGTNTIERIAASSEVLKALREKGILSLIATHDLELCGMAGEGYDMAHFEEHITDTDIVFDYLLRPGPATSRNAIHLLKLIGFDDTIVRAAHDRADRYLKTGKWEEAQSE